jgi:hypothetical protein
MALNGNLTDGPVIHVCPAQARILREALGVYQAAKTAFIGACATQAAGRYDGAKIARELVLDDAIARSHQDESMTAEERIAALLKDNVGLTMPDLVAAVKPETPAPAGPATDVRPDATQTTQKPADAPPAVGPAQQGGV